MTTAEFSAKWDIRFRDNTFFEISEADLREFKDDLLLVFGLQGANVPYYKAGADFQKDYLVRYVLAGQPESFFYSLKAGKLPAPTAGGDLNWKVVPGPVSTTALSQVLTLLQAQGIQGDQVVAGRDYLIDWGNDAAGYQKTVTVRGISNNSFDTEGTLEVNGVITPVEAIDVFAATYQLKYSRAQTDALLAGKQPTINGVKQYSLYGYTNNVATYTLMSTDLRKYVTFNVSGLTTMVVLPALTLAQHPSVMVIDALGGAGPPANAQLQITGQVNNSPVVLATLSLGESARLETYLTTYNDYSGGYPPVPRQAVSWFLSGLIRPKAPGYVLPAVGTVVAFIQDAEYAPIYSGTFTVDPIGAKVGTVVFVELGASATQPSLPSQFELEGGSYVAGKRLSYGFRVSASGTIRYIINQLP